MKVLKAPQPLPPYRRNGVIPRSLFLAGSIEMGVAEDWQTTLTNYISVPENNVKCDYIFNPRRESWDSSWEQSITNPQFNEQVSWEMTALDAARSIIMYLDPATKSPISLLELGLHAASRKIIVCCPKGFWRRGNVEMVCDRFDIRLFDGKPTDEPCINLINYMLNT
jgi:hypothetical protein